MADPLSVGPEREPVSVGSTPVEFDFNTGSYERGEQFRTWSNQLDPIDTARTVPWGAPGEADAYIEVVGSDEALVAGEYDRRLAEVRQPGFALPPDSTQRRA